MADGLYKHRSGVWYVRFRYQGREFRRSTGEANRRKAAQAARRFRASVEQTYIAPPKEKRADTLEPTLEVLAALDIAEHENRGVTAIAINREELRWAKIIENANPELHPGRITYDWLREYEGRRRKQGIKGQTIIREFRAFKRALTIARRRGWVAEVPDPWPRVRSDPPDKRTAGKLWPVEVLREWLAMLHPDARDEAGFIMYTGIRATECKRVRADWVEPAPGLGVAAILRIPESAAKTRKERVVGLPDPALAIIRRRVQENPTAPLVFSQRDFRRHRDTMARGILGKGSDTITLRDLRHTYATLALQGTQDPVAVMRALGHADLKTTEKYLTSPLQRIAGAGLAVEKLLKDKDDGYKD